MGLEHVSLPIVHQWLDGKRNGLLDIIGYSIIAVPTGIVSVEIARANRKNISTQVCPNCAREGHEVDAVYCQYCGAKLNEDGDESD